MAFRRLILVVEIVGVESMGACKSMVHGPLGAGVSWPGVSFGSDSVPFESCVGRSFPLSFDWPATRALAEVQSWM